MTSPAKLFFVAGELSGDAHAAAVMEALQAELARGVIFAGLGGAKMRARGGETVLDWTEEAAVVGLWEVLKHYGYFRRRFEETVVRVRDWRPDAVVLVDYPGFNLRLAARLRREGFPGKIVHYISPQVWAWNRGRIPKMAKWLDLMLCIFPFEKALYEASGLPTEFVGHPLAEEFGKLPPLPREENLLGLFPGSRRREVAKLLDPMLAAARELREQRPSLRVAVAAATASLAELMAPACRTASAEVLVGQAHDLMRRATVGAVASGTATLEAAFLGLPYCLAYKVAPLTYAVGKRVVKVPFLGIVNILADREVVPELIQDRATGSEIARALERLLSDEPARRAMRNDLTEVTRALGGQGAAKNAAAAIARCLAA